MQSTATFVLDVAVADSGMQITATFVLEVAVAGSRHEDKSYIFYGGSSCG